jgi:hypothetical protein
VSEASWGAYQTITGSFNIRNINVNSQNKHLKSLQQSFYIKNCFH